MTFADRREAGRFLAAKLQIYSGRDDALVLGLPRGGVPVAFEVATALALPLDVFVVRKLGVPGQEELAMGAIATGGVEVLNRDVLAQMAHPAQALTAVLAEERGELARRETTYRGAGQPPLDIRGRLALLVDDGLATGATMRAAIRAVRQAGAAHCVVAVPIGSPEACAAVRAEADRLVCGTTPGDFQAVGHAYRNFDQTSDAEVRALLAQHREGRSIR